MGKPDFRKGPEVYKQVNDSGNEKLMTQAIESLLKNKTNGENIFFTPEIQVIDIKRIVGILLYYGNNNLIEFLIESQNNSDKVRKIVEATKEEQIKIKEEYRKQKEKEIDESFSCDLVGFTFEQKKKLEKINDNLNGNHQLLNKYNFKINNRFIRYHNNKIILLPENTKKIEKDYSVGGKEFYLFQEGKNKNLYLYQNNDYILLSSDKNIIINILEENNIIIFNFETENGKKKYKTAILETNNTLNYIPFDDYKEFKRTIKVGDIIIFEIFYGSYTTKYYLNENGKWEEYKFFHKGEGRNEEILFSASINGKDILLSKYYSDRTLLVDGTKIQLPGNMGEIQKITEHNGKILFSANSRDNYYLQYYFLNDNLTWEGPFNYLNEDLYIHSFDLDIDIKSGKIFSFDANKILAILSNDNQFKILKDIRENNNNYKRTYTLIYMSYYKSKNGEIFFVYEKSIVHELVFTGRRYSEIHKLNNNTQSLEEDIITLEGIIEIAGEYDKKLLIKLDNNQYSILNKAGEFVKFNIQGTEIEQFQIVKMSDNQAKKIYIFDVNGQTKIYNEEEFEKLYNENTN